MAPTRSRDHEAAVSGNTRDQELLPAKLPLTNVIKDGGGTMCCFLVVGGLATCAGIYLVIYHDLIKGVCLTSIGAVAFMAPFFSICFAYVKHSDMAELARRTGITCSMTIHGPLLTQQTPTISTIFRDGLTTSTNTSTGLTTSDNHKRSIEPNGTLPPLALKELRRLSMRNVAQSIEDTNLGGPVNGSLKPITTQPTSTSGVPVPNRLDPT